MKHKTVYFNIGVNTLCRCGLKLSNKQMSEEFYLAVPGTIFFSRKATRRNSHEVNFPSFRRSKNSHTIRQLLKVACQGAARTCSPSEFNKLAKERRIQKKCHDFVQVCPHSRSGRTLHTKRAALFVPPASSSLLVDIITVHVSPADADWLSESGSTEGD